MGRWLAEHWHPMSEDFVRFAILTTVDVAREGAGRVEFEDDDGYVAVLSAAEAQAILPRAACLKEDGSGG
jgi:hypothetical protein